MKIKSFSQFKLFRLTLQCLNTRHRNTIRMRLSEFLTRLLSYFYKFSFINLFENIARYHNDDFIHYLFFNKQFIKSYNILIVRC